MNASLADLIEKQRAGLQLPELGSSLALGQPRQVSLDVIPAGGMTSPVEAGASSVSSGLAAAGAPAAATLIGGLMQAQALQESQQRKSSSQAQAEIGKGLSESISQSSQAQINPLKSLIANYRAAIR